MPKNLGRIAAGGFCVGFTGLFLAYAVGDSSIPDFSRFSYLRHLGDWGANFPFERTCALNDVKDATTQGERRWVWDGGDDVEISLPSARIRYLSGEGHEVIVRAAPDVLTHVTVSDGQISLDCNGLPHDVKIDVILPGRTFRIITLAGSGEISLQNVDQPDLELRIAGSGSVSAQGTVERLELSISGSGDAQLAALAMKQLRLHVTGSGNAEAAPTDDAEIVLSGSGNVKLLSRPLRLQTHITGSGRVIQTPLQTTGIIIEKPFTGPDLNLLNL
jgi:hypothetical protein